MNADWWPIVVKKEKAETMERNMDGFTQGVIPFIYNLRSVSFPLFSEIDPHVAEMGRIIQSDDAKRTMSSFLLTVLRRVCKRFDKDVSLGIYLGYYWEDEYFNNKNKQSMV